MKRVLALMLCLLLVSGCGAGQASDDDTLTVVATTYTGYLAARAVTDGVDGIRVERIDTGSSACLHDYTLTVSDMKKLERADVVVLNGAGMEAFLNGVLRPTDAFIIDCSAELVLFPLAEDQKQVDGHYWMSPSGVSRMIENVLISMSHLLPEAEKKMQANAALAVQQLDACRSVGRSMLDTLNIPGLVTLHNGFAYFAAALDLPVLAAIEEEAGSEASAMDISRITRLVREHKLPVIFVETNGSDATANAISRETGCRVGRLSLITDGREPAQSDISPIVPYTELFMANVQAVRDGFMPEADAQ